MTRCCLCRHPYWIGELGLETTLLPGSGYRCTDRTACAQRVAGIVGAHKGLGEVCADG